MLFDCFGVPHRWMLSSDRGRFSDRFPPWAVGVRDRRVPFASDIRDDDFSVGPGFFDEHFGAAHGPAAQRSLVPAFDRIEDDFFDPSRVHPLIREFYQDSAAFNLVLQRVTWRRPFDYVAPVYSHLASRVFRQLAVPSSTTTARPMYSDYGELDVDNDGTPDYRTWIRYFPPEGAAESRIFYVAALRTIRLQEGQRRRSFLSVCLPLRRGNKCSVFAFVNDPAGGLTLTTSRSDSNIAGSYLVFHDVPVRGRVTYLPALGLGETLRFWVHPGTTAPYILGEHLESWRRREVFRLEYRIERGEGRQIRLERATDAISSAG